MTFKWFKHANKDIKFNKEEKEKEELHCLWKEAFDYNSQNVKYDSEIIDLHPKTKI